MGAMSYISVLDCDICGWVVVSLLVRVGVYMCMCVRGKKGDLLVQALVLCQFGLVSDFWCVCVCVWLQQPKCLGSGSVPAGNALS